MNLCSLVHNNRISPAVSESQASASHDDLIPKRQLPQQTPTVLSCSCQRWKLTRFANWGRSTLSSTTVLWRRRYKQLMRCNLNANKWLHRVSLEHSLVTLHMAGRANRGWRLLMWLHDGKTSRWLKARSKVQKFKLKICFWYSFTVWHCCATPEELQSSSYFSYC